MAPLSLSAFDGDCDWALEIHGDKMWLKMVVTGSTIWLFNIAMENPLTLGVYSWENHL